MNFMNGSILELNLASTEGGPTLSFDRIEVIPGQGILGDRKFQIRKSSSKVYKRQITFIEIEQINRFNDIYGMNMKPSETRRNVVTAGVDLNSLVGCEFKVGNIALRGTMLCEPCKYLQNMTLMPVIEGYLHRGGLCAEILDHGYLCVGDQISNM